MSKITSPVKYDKTIFMYAASRTLERSAFYGMRSIICLYMYKGLLSFSLNDTMLFYGWYVKSFVAAGIIGALLGDLVIGNRKALLLGNILMSIGLFVLCIPSAAFFYAGIILFAIGSGFYTPNLLARFGKQFYTKPELTDGGFTILYVLINVGSFLGVLIVGLAGFDNYPLGFALAGIVMLGSTIVSFLNKDNASTETQPVVASNNTNSALIILLTILGIGLYWYLFDTSYNGLYFLQTKIEEFSTDLNRTIWTSFSSVLSIMIGIAVALIYSFYYFSRALKLALAFIIAAVGLGITLFISIPVSANGPGIMFGAIFLLSIAELVMAPVVYGLITQRTNPKYLALVMSLSFVPFAVFNLIIPRSFKSVIDDTDTMSIMVCAPLLAIMGIIAYVFWIMKKKQHSTV